MDKIIEALQKVLGVIGFGTSVLGGIGSGTEQYGVAEQKIAGGTDAFVGVFKTIWNFIAGLANFGTLE